MTSKLVHFEIVGPDDQALVAFYHHLLGWPTDHRGPGYTLVRPEDGPSGAIIESAENRVTLGVTVTDVQATVARAADLGGEVLMPPTDNGWVTKALIADPAGNTISLIADHPSPGR